MSLPKRVTLFQPGREPVPGEKHEILICVTRVAEALFTITLSPSSVTAPM